MKPDYLLSVVVPVHNTVKYLPKCVESIRSQSLKEIEIILVDNLSTDGSSELCDNYALIDPRVKVLHLSEAGLSIARNAGIAASTAPVIGFVDSDDYISHSMYEEMLNALVDQDADLVYSNYCCEYDDGRKEYPYQDSQKVLLRSPRDVARELIWDKVSSSVCTKLFKKELFETLAFPVGLFFEDHITTFKWIVMCDKIVWVDKTFYHYYQRETSICHTLDPIKHYHYFLAEYARLAFIKEHALFMADELEKTNTMIVKHCFMHFREVLLMIKPSLFKEPICDMKEKIKELHTFTKGEISNKYYKRIRKVIYFWPLYYTFHYGFKKKRFDHLC